MPVGIVAAGAAFTQHVAAGLARRFGTPAAREGLRTWLPHAGLKAPLGKALAAHGWRVLPAMEVLNIGVPLALRLGLDAPPHANPEAELAAVAEAWTLARPTLTPGAAVKVAADFIALKAQLARAQTTWDDALAALRMARPTLAADVAAVDRFHREWLGGLPSAAAAAQARLAGLAEHYEAGLAAPVVMAGFAEFSPMGLRVARAVAADARGLVLVPDTPLGHGLAAALGGGEVWEGEAVAAAVPVVMEADDTVDEAWAVAMAARDALRQGAGPVAIVAEDPGVAARARDVLAATGVMAGGDGATLTATPAGRLACAVTRAMAAPTAEAVAAVLQHPLPARRAGWAGAASALELVLLRGLGSVASWHGWARTWRRLQRARERKIQALVLAAQPAWEGLEGLMARYDAMGLGQFRDGLAAAMDGLAPDWRTVPGGFETAQALAGLDGEDAVALPLLAAVVEAALRNRQAPLPEEHAGVVIMRAADARLRPWGTVIVAGCNAGCWPARVDDAWFGQGQLAGLGLHDDAHLARVAAEEWDGLQRCGGRVVFSRAAHGADGVALVPSALWQAHLAGLDKDARFLAQGRAWRRQGAGAAVPDGALAPVGEVYPRTWSASLIEDMRTCPYRALARRVLRLEPLPDFDAVPERRELGILFHAWMERLPWVKEEAWADAAALAGALLAAGEPLLEDFDEAVQALWRPRLPLLARALAVELLEHRAKGWTVAEVEAALPQAMAGGIHVSAKADRVDARGAARVVIDYKTGQAPGLAAMARGDKPQLPIEAWLLEQAGAQDVAAAVWRLRGFGARPLEVVPFGGPAWRGAVAAVGPGIEQMAAQFREGSPWPAWPDLKKGGVLPSGHCADCPLAGVCRFQERAA